MSNLAARWLNGLPNSVDFAQSWNKYITCCNPLICFNDENKKKARRLKAALNQNKLKVCPSTGGMLTMNVNCTVLEYFHMHM